VSTTDVSRNAREARSQRRGHVNRGSASPDNGTTKTARTPLDDAQSTPVNNQLPRAPVLLNPQRLA
jgi:hypothetical protein